MTTDYEYLASTTPYQVRCSDLPDPVVLSVVSYSYWPFFMLDQPIGSVILKTVFHYIKLYLILNSSLSRLDFSGRLSVQYTLLKTLVHDTKTQLLFQKQIDPLYIGIV